MFDGSCLGAQAGLLLTLWIWVVKSVLMTGWFRQAGNFFSNEARVGLASGVRNNGLELSNL
jgi:hypothetical protein